MGHHHGHPLTGVMELRPDHWSATLKVSPRDFMDLRTDTDQSFSINQKGFNMHTHIYIYITYQFLIIHLFRIPSKNPYQPIVLEPWIWNSILYQYHASLKPTIPIRSQPRSYPTHHFQSKDHTILAYLIHSCFNKGNETMQ